MNESEASSAGLCWPGIEQLDGGELQQPTCFLHGSRQPSVHIARFNRNYAALVLSVRRCFRVGLVHALHKRVRIRVDGQHRVALMHLARG